MYPKIAEYLRDRTVLLVGFGREGQSSYRYLRQYFPEKPIAIADKNAVTVEDPFVTCICGDRYLDCIGDFDLVLKSPGISFKEVDAPAHTEITCQVDLFLRFADCHKIGITGSKGKTTTSTLTYQMLKAAGKDCRLIGNIGVPVFDSLGDLTPDTVAVIEMSSHQLEFTHASPEVAVLTNLYEEHLEHYKGGYAGYTAAKSHIALYQSAQDVFIYNATQGLGDFPCPERIQAQKIGIHEGDSLPFAVDNEHLAGVHNRQDVLFARAAAARFGATDEACEAAVRHFKGIEHRMEKVGTFKGITFYNDCIATIPHAVLCAVEAIGTVGTLIVGGKDRGIDYNGFVADLQNSQISTIIGTPETGHAIVHALEAAGAPQRVLCAADLEEAVQLAYRYTEAGKACLLSPAASSYNVYKNFEEKGRHYKALVKAYAEK